MLGRTNGISCSWKWVRRHPRSPLSLALRPLVIAMASSALELVAAMHRDPVGTAFAVLSPAMAWRPAMAIKRDPCVLEELHMRIHAAAAEMHPDVPARGIAWVFGA